MKYDNIDFLEQFDAEHLINRENNQLFKYSIRKNTTELEIIVAPIENKIFVSLVGMAEFHISNIHLITCDKSQPEIVRFLFYKTSMEYPFVIIYLKPAISMDLDLEQTGYY